MAKPDRGRRFRRLAPQTGDLFEHFGVAPTPADPPADPPLTAAAACAGCGWWRPDPTAEPCWLCGAPPPKSP